MKSARAVTFNLATMTLLNRGKQSTVNGVSAGLKEEWAVSHRKVGIQNSSCKELVSVGSAFASPRNLLLYTHNSTAAPNEFTTESANSSKPIYFGSFSAKCRVFGNGLSVVDWFGMELFFGFARPS